MTSIFDFLFGSQQAYNPAGGATPPFNPNGQRTPSILDSPEYGQQRMNDALSGMAQALIAAGAPSAQPRGFLDAFGAAGAGALGGMQNSEDRFLKRTMINSQVRKNQQEMDNDKAWREMFNAGGVAPSTPVTQTASPSAAPAAGGGVSPNNIGNVRPVGGGPNSGFQQPPTIEAGVQLAVNTARAYPKAFNNGQPMSLLQIGERWAPKGDGANDPAQWARNVASIGGLPLDQPINLDDPAQAAAFARGVHGAEHGGKAIRPAEFYQAALTAAPQPAVAQGGGDASGNPVQQAQYSPPQAYRPRTMQDVIQTVPPGVRQMIGAMGRKEGMAALMKYADPGSEAVLDTQTNQIVFIPKTMVGRDPRYAPAKVAELDLQRRQLANSERKTDIDERNADVTVGNDGKPIVNQTAVDAKTAVSRAQGTDPSSKITVELAQDAIKRNSDWQTAGVKAQSSIGRLGALNSLLDQVTTGKFKGTTTEIKAAAKGAGIDLEAMGIKDDVAPSQAIIALTNLMALENRDPSTGAGMPGAMSDADRAYLQQASVSITKDAAGNKILIGIKKGDLQRQVDIAKFAREYIKSPEFKTNPAGLDDYVAEKIAGKNYYDPSLLQNQKKATDDYLTNTPPPPPGFSVPGQAAPGGTPAPPAGFRIVR